MSTIAINPVIPSLVSRVLKQLKHYNAKKNSQTSHYNDLHNLPDHLLLDIGIDPRSVAIRLDEAIAQPDLLNKGVVTLHHKAIAKS